MELTLQTINILFFLIPGFIASFIIDSIIVRKELTPTSRIIESLIFTFLIYIIVSIFTSIELFAQINENNGEIHFKLNVNWDFLSVLLIVTVTLPIIFGAILFYDLHLRFLRWIRITDKTSRDTTWQDVFIEQKRYIVIHHTDGRRIFGWPLYYSNIPENGYIYLYEPAWINETNEFVDCKTHGILIKSENISFIEFMFFEDEDGKKDKTDKK